MSDRTPPPPGSPGTTDWAHVVDRVMAGDRVAFAQLARLVTGCLAQWRAFDFRDDWDDVVQEVVLAVVQARREGRIANAGSTPGYVRQTARFKFIDRIRERQREAPDRDPEAASSAESVWPPRADEPAIETRIAVWTAVDGLPEKERIAVVEVYARGKSYEEAARDNAIPLGSLKRYLRDGLAALNAALEAGS